MISRDESKEKAEGMRRYKEETERGDVAKSIQGLIETQYMSKRFKDIMGSTRLTKTEVVTLSVMEINRITMKILSLNESDMKEESMNQLTPEERIEVKELYALKVRFMKNPTAMAYVLFDAFMYMFGLGLQSLDGGSRQEGMNIAGGSFKRIMEPDELGRFERIKRRLFGNVLFTE